MREARDDRSWLQLPRNLRRRIMPPSGDFLPDWELFSHHFTTLRVDPSRPRFPEKWQFILVRAYHRRCLDAARKRGWRILPCLRFVG